MKSIIVNKYGGPDYLELVDVAKPNILSGDVLVRVDASCVSTADTMMRKGEPRFARLFLGLGKPRVNQIGTGFSGTVVEVGSKVGEFSLGDKVFGMTSMSFAANSEFVKIHASECVWKKPEFLSHEQAACMCDGVTTSMNFLTRLIDAKAGQKILINGASGALGMAAVGIAKSLGLYVIAAVSPVSFELMLSLGADEVVDYRDQRFFKSFGVNDELHFSDLVDGLDYIFDTVGKLKFADVKFALGKHGLYLTPVLDRQILGAWLNPFARKRKQMKFDATGLLKPDVFDDFISRSLSMIERGEVQVVMDQVFDFKDFRLAHAYVDTGRKKGNVALKH